MKNQTQKQLQESAIRKIHRVLNENRDTTWAAKQIDAFIANNETADNEKDFGGSISMKLFGSKPSTNFNITFDELRQISALLKRLNRGAAK